MKPDQTKLKQLPQHARRVFAGTIFDTYQWDQVQFDGSHATYERLIRPDTIAVIPVTRQGTILLIEEEQPGVPQRTAFVGGRLEDGEDPQTGANRELLEETGYTGDLKLWFTVTPQDKVLWTIWTYVAHNCTKSKEQHLDGGERITVHEVSFEVFADLAARNKLRSPELAIKFLEAKLDPAKMDALRGIILGEHA